MIAKYVSTSLLCSFLLFLVHELTFGPSFKTLTPSAVIVPSDLGMQVSEFEFSADVSSAMIKPSYIFGQLFDSIRTNSNQSLVCLEYSQRVNVKMFRKGTIHQQVAAIFETEGLHITLKATNQKMMKLQELRGSTKQIALTLETSRCGISSMKAKHTLNYLFKNFSNDSFATQLTNG